MSGIIVICGSIFTTFYPIPGGFDFTPPFLICIFYFNTALYPVAVRRSPQQQTNPFAAFLPFLPFGIMAIDLVLGSDWEGESSKICSWSCPWVFVVVELWGMSLTVGGAGGGDDPRPVGTLARFGKAPRWLKMVMGQAEEARSGGGVAAARARIIERSEKGRD
ncbi:hypothetical protein AX16_009798 [Volvariella volvacea WC 439]|nr:hypothetical protein AX16_009798 [Volvariella volvacea WC 439]